MNEKLAEFQALKLQHEKKVKLGGIFAVIGLILTVLLINQGPFGLIIVIPSLIVMGIGFNGFNKLSFRFKTEVLSEVIVSFIDEGQYLPTSGLSETQVYSSEFIKRADRYHSEDYLKGKMDGVSFVSSDIKLEERHVEHTKNGTRTYYETYFLGRLFIFEFNKNFDGYLQVLENGRPQSRRKFEKVKLESVDFNKKFKTYSTNDLSAFYVLTPHLMEALMNFEKHNKGSISFSFIDSRVYIGINNFKDTFKLKMFKVLDETTFKEFQRELEVIKEIVVELKLNNDIFKKE